MGRCSDPVAHGRGRRVNLTPTHRVYGLGAILLASLFVCSRNFSRVGDPSFLVPLAVASVAYLLAIREFFFAPTFPRHVIVTGLVLAALWHLQFLRMPPGSDDVIHRYVWYVRGQRLGYDPYVVVPMVAAFRHFHTSSNQLLDHPELPIPYVS